MSSLERYVEETRTTLPPINIGGDDPIYTTTVLVYYDRTTNMYCPYPGGTAYKYSSDIPRSELRPIPENYPIDI